MSIETTFMKYSHGKKGTICSTLKPEARKFWSLSLNICSRMEEDLREMSSVILVDADEQHNEEKRGRIKADAKDKVNIRSKST
ncbi:hypothetical protein DPMN_194041 [Dreissena polymorpha]|uniref:Uncharacterized protein n=1 Tax=Dreissena polymorpha TaxID=45954 RepID=A0A9D4B6T6_DREPO|nr:hypothetical protein DPMN_194041 [Dreissena polymorpha]